MPSFTPATTLALFTLAASSVMAAPSMKREPEPYRLMPGMQAPPEPSLASGVRPIALREPEPFRLLPGMQPLQSGDAKGNVKALKREPVVVPPGTDLPAWNPAFGVSKTVANREPEPFKLEPGVHPVTDPKLPNGEGPVALKREPFKLQPGMKPVTDPKLPNGEGPVALRSNSLEVGDQKIQPGFYGPRDLHDIDPQRFPPGFVGPREPAPIEIGGHTYPGFTGPRDLHAIDPQRFPPGFVGPKRASRFNARLAPLETTGPAAPNFHTPGSVPFEQPGAIGPLEAKGKRVLPTTTGPAPNFHTPGSVPFEQPGAILHPPGKRLAPLETTEGPLIPASSGPQQVPALAASGTGSPSVKTDKLHRSTPLEVDGPAEPASTTKPGLGFRPGFVGPRFIIDGPNGAIRPACKGNVCPLKRDEDLEARVIIEGPGGQLQQPACKGSICALRRELVRAVADVVEKRFLEEELD